MQIEAIIKRLTEEFIHHWNNWDMEKMSGYLHEDVVVRSPFVSSVFPENSDQCIKGRREVLEYWRRLEPLSSDLKFSLESLEKKDHKIYTVSSVWGEDYKLYTQFCYNEYGKVYELVFEYQ